MAVRDIGGGVALLAATGKSYRKSYRRFDGCPTLFTQPSTRIRYGAIAGPLPLIRKFLDRIPNGEPGVPC
jgi:hypothetical protein